jgi:hypothetical protein
MDDDEEVPNDLEEEHRWNETTDDRMDDDAETLGIEANSIAATFIATLDILVR